MLCEICNKKLKIYKNLKEFNLLRCHDCAHTVSDIKVNKRYYKKTYSRTYVYKKHKNWMNNPNFELFKKINLFIKSKKSGNIIDLGCGIGNFLNYLYNENNKYNLTGVDLIAKKINKKSKIKFIKKEIFKYNPKSLFSFIVSIAVIEHIPKVKLFINHIKRISKKNSYCVILTVNTNSFLYKIANFLYSINLKTPFLRLYDPHHLNHFSNKSLEKIFKKNGFKVIQRVKTPISMKQIDFNYNNVLMKFIFYFGVSIILKLENFFNKSWLQTVIFKKG